MVYTVHAYRHTIICIVYYMFYAYLMYIFIFWNPVRSDSGNLQAPDLDNIIVIMPLRCKIYKHTYVLTVCLFDPTQEIPPTIFFLLQ